MPMKHTTEIKHNKLLEMPTGGKQWTEEGLEQGSSGFYSKSGNLTTRPRDHSASVRHHFLVFFFQSINSEVTKA